MTVTPSLSRPALYECTTCPTSPPPCLAYARPPLRRMGRPRGAAGYRRRRRQVVVRVERADQGGQGIARDIRARRDDAFNERVQVAARRSNALQRRRPRLRHRGMRHRRPHRRARQRTPVRGARVIQQTRRLQDTVGEGAHFALCEMSAKMALDAAAHVVRVARVGIDGRRGGWGARVPSFGSRRHSSYVKDDALRGLAANSDDLRDWPAAFCPASFDRQTRTKNRPPAPLPAGRKKKKHSSRLLCKL